MRNRIARYKLAGAVFAAAVAAAAQVSCSIARAEEAPEPREPSIAHLDQYGGDASVERAHDWLARNCDRSAAEANGYPCILLSPEAAANIQRELDAGIEARRLIEALLRNAKPRKNTEDNSV